MSKMLDAVRSNVRWFQMMVRADNDAATHYDLLDSLKVIRNRDGMPLVNLGYWKDVSPDDPDGLWKAIQALFHRTAEIAQMGPADGRVLDVGCGYGTNAIYCMQNFNPGRVIGLNVSDAQLRSCRERSARAQLSERLEFVKGSATAMPFADGSIDKVISVEAAHHFEPRSAFFREARRVLKPGGILAMADHIVLPPRNPLQRLHLNLLRRTLQIPEQNVYGLDRYREGLEDAGFEIEVMTSIRELVFDDYERWLYKHKLRDVVQMTATHFLGTFSFFWYPWDYVHVRARCA